MNTYTKSICEEFERKMDEWATLAAKTLKGILYYKETFKNELKETFLKFINDDNKAWKAQQDLLA